MPASTILAAAVIAASAVAPHGAHMKVCSGARCETLSAPARSMRLQLGAHETATWQGRCYVGGARVNGRRGRWDDRAAEYTWGRVWFDGLTFYNERRVSVRVSASC